MFSKENEPFINRELLAKVERVRNNELLHDDSWKTWEKDVNAQEERHLSELYRVLENYTQTDLAVATIVAMENFPMMVLQIVAEYIINKEGEQR